MHEIFFLSDILFTSCYFTCTCLILEISLFGSIVVNIVVKVFHIWHSDPYMDRLRPSQVYVRCHGRQETIFEYEIDREGRNRYCNTYFVSPLLKIVGNNKLWTHMQKESWNIDGKKILICSITLNGTEWDQMEHKQTEGYVVISKEYPEKSTPFHGW
jgi:hypothetical protein